MSPKNRFGEDEDDPLPEDGEPPEDDQPADEEPCGCDNGWLDYVDADHPTPCPRCKPDLAAGRRVRFH